MPRAKNFDRIPSFPEDVAVANLSKLTLSKLLEHDVAESEQLYRACKDTGFFLLDLTDSSIGEIMLDNAESIFQLSEELFNHDKDELDKFPFVPEKSLCG